MNAPNQHSAVEERFAEVYATTNAYPTDAETAKYWFLQGARVAIQEQLDLIGDIKSVLSEKAATVF